METKTWTPRQILIAISLAIGAIVLASTIWSCNPLKQVQKNIAKSEQAKADLAKVCSDQFPVSAVSYSPGSVDTNAIVNSILGTLDKLCPTYQPTPSNETDYTPVPTNTKIAPSGLARTPFKIPQSTLDSIIAATKKAIAPDTMKIKIRDSIVFLLQENKNLLKTNVDLVAQVAIDAQYKEQAHSRLIYLIGISVFVVGLIGVSAYLKFKKMALPNIKL